MLDALSAPPSQNITIRREDYRPPDWHVSEVHLDFQLYPDATTVHATLTMARYGEHDRPIRLHGDGLTAQTVLVDGEECADWSMDKADLIIPAIGDAHRIETIVTINPAANTQLMGLYVSGGNFCTQCEAEGFRRITFFPDRPDVLSRYSVRMEADKAEYPVLLSNGNCTASGDGDKGRHWAEWSDPFPKPSYLFALVAGNLSANRDVFTTMSGKQVDLAIWVAEDDLSKTGHAMQALKDSMAWDEKVYGREYDLSEFHIVAVADFNFGAMENKSLNIFNSRYVLADPDIATDFDYNNISGIVAHEYFHNWSGNRITCRDWFQLSLKEGFTVYRDQCFTEDHASRAVKRIEDVRQLRSIQFPEDASPLAHPVRPESYMEISNFYTSTIYNKGAELIRMMHTLAGPERFRKGTDLYFDRHDGQAATCEDFVVAMEEGAGLDLSQFRLWYSQSGTPRVSAKLSHDASGGTATLNLSQAIPETPGQKHKQPMAIPISFALLDRTTGAHSGSQLHVLKQEHETISFSGFSAPPILSINRGFAAPITIDTPRSQDELAFLSAHDDDPFARYEAMQQLMLATLLEHASTGQADHAPVIEAVRKTLSDPALDSALIAEAVLMPSDAFVGDQMVVVDPDAIRRASVALQKDLAAALDNAWRAAQHAPNDGAFELTPAAMGKRRLRTVALGYIMASGANDAGKIALAQYESATNMTDRDGALRALAGSKAAERQAALDHFYARYEANPLVLDKWFMCQALAARDDTPKLIETLKAHPAFTLTNPNRVRALYTSFGSNQWAFHTASGKGYALMADLIIELDAINPQTAARLVTPLGRFKRYDAGRQALAKAQLERILATPNLSKDVFEQVSKSLG